MTNFSLSFKTLPTTLLIFLKTFLFGRAEALRNIKADCKLQNISDLVIAHLKPCTFNLIHTL